MKTGWTAMRLGAILFIIPLIFVFDPSFVLNGSIIGILKAIVTGALGTILIASGFEGYLFFVGRLSVFRSILSVLSGLLIFIPVGVLQIVGIVAVALLVSGKFLGSNRATPVGGITQ
jgi:TRAP-type uncharacterized transport system fused permease subunit